MTTSTDRLGVASARSVGSALFVGNATVLLRLGGFTLLTDPNFLHRGERAYLGYGLWSPRRTEPALTIDALPPLDLVILSHLHGDHFDRRARRGLDRATPIVTTPQAASRLDRWGFGAAGALHPWQCWEQRRGDELVRVTAVPGRHGPGVVHRLMPPVMGSIVDFEQGGARRYRLYVTGDTLYRPWLAEVAERFEGIDAAMVHLGGTRVLGVLLTMDGRQGADLVATVRPTTTFPIHYDDYPVMRSPLRDFLAAADRRGITGVQPLYRGQTAPLSPAVSNDR